MDTPELLKISHSRIDPFIFPIATKLYHSLRIPPSVRPELILLSGHVIALCGAIAFWAAQLIYWYGLLATFFVLAYQFTDILDGLHARSTSQCRNSGEFLDHFLDPLSFSYLLVGLSLYVNSLPLAVASVICMFATATLINVRAQITRQFTLPTFGATELRLSLAFIGVALSVLSSFSGPIIAKVVIEILLWVLLAVGLGQLIVQLIRTCRQIDALGIQPNTSPWEIRGKG